MRHLKGILMSVIIFSMLFLAQVPSVLAAAKADTVLYNGHIFTSNPLNPWVSAVAFSQCIMDVGSDQKILAYQGPRTEVIDLQGKTVIPGINDAHRHLLPYITPNGMWINDPYQFIPNPGPTLAEMMGLIQQLNVIIPTTTWFYGIVGEAFLEDPEATRFALDLVSPERPVIITGWSGHYLLVNSAALIAAGITENTPDPEGGHYVRTVEGIMTGEMQDYAIYGFAQIMRSQIPDEVFAQQIPQLLMGCAQQGITTAQCMEIGIESSRMDDILKKLEKDGQLPIKFRNIGFPLTYEESQHIYDDRPWPDLFQKYYSEGIKWIEDGTEQESGMYLAQPYYDKPDWFGRLVFPTEIVAQLSNTLGDPSFGRYQRLFHANGDGTIDLILNVMNQLTWYDCLWACRRPRIEHGMEIRPDQIPELAAKGIVVVKAPSQFIMGQTIFSRVGPVRFTTQTQLLRSLFEGGVSVALSSDQLGGLGNPFFDLKMCAAHPLNSNEAISMETAVMAYTLGSAYAEFKPYKGWLGPGCVADLAILSQNIFDLSVIPYMESTVSLRTYVNGEAVYDAGVL